MRFENSLEVDASIDRVREAVRDVAGLGACIPGCEQVSVVEDGQKYTAIVRERLGPFHVSFVLDVQLEATEDSDTVLLKVEGRDTRLGSRLSQSIILKVAAISPRRTRLDMVTDVAVYGKLGTLGRPIVERKAGEITREFGRRFQEWLAADLGRPQDNSRTPA